MDRRSCQESIEKKPRNLDGLRIRQDLSRKEKEGLERNGIYRGFVEKLSNLKKRCFIKKGKTHRDECNKQVTQTKIQPTC